MAAEELVADQHAADPAANPVARDLARWADSRQLTPVAMGAIALGFGVIAAGWLTSVTLRAEVIAFMALVAAFVAGRAARLMGGGVITATTEWALTACAVLTEFAVYAGIAGSSSASSAATSGTALTGPVGTRLQDTWVAGLGGPGEGGVWRLAVAAAIVLGLLQMAELSVAASPAPEIDLRRFQLFAGAPGGDRLLLAGAAVLLAGARVALALLLVLGLLAFAAIFARRSGDDEYEAAEGAAPGRADGDPEGQAWLQACRGDGPLAVWAGRFVGGRLPPLPPLLVGLLVTGMLAALGLQNLSGILALTPVEAMMLAALASWHPHDGRRDWLAPTLLQAGEYLFLAAAGFAGRVPPPVTFALVAAVGLRHLDLAGRARNQVPPGQFGRITKRQARGLPYTDQRGLGWEGRMLLTGVALAAGIVPFLFPVLALYLWGLLGWEFAVGWSAGHAAVDG